MQHKKRSVVKQLMPMKQIVFLLVNICLIEIIVMLFIADIEGVSPYFVALIDSFVLGLLVIPIVYWFLYRGTAVYMEENELIKEELKANEQKYRTLFHMANDAIFMHPIKEDGSYENFTEVNDTACKNYGYSREELLQMKPTDMVAKGTPIIDISTKEQITFETKHITKTGEVIPVEISIKNFILNGVNTALAVVRDIGERKKAAEQINYLAFHDILTGLPNRNKFNELLLAAIEDAKKQNTKLAVMFVDLDGFKEVNDQYGHLTGDEVLSISAKRLKNCIRKEDAVARMGGDEFTLLFPQIENKEKMILIADKIIKTIQDPIVIRGNIINITASLGIVIFPEGGRDSETLLKNADSAMYLAKHKGKNNYQVFAKTETA